jgi:UDP-glucose 4-epimerase
VTYNLGTNRGFSVLELVRTFEKVTGQKVPLRIVERRPGDIAVSYADASKAHQELGWSAQRGIEEICADVWRWQSSHPNGYE